MEWKYDKDAGKLAPKPVAGYDPEITNCCNGVVYNPDSEGCCKKPDGTYEVTDNPENAVPCDHVSEVIDDVVAANPSLNPDDILGIIVCYNGNKFACLNRDAISPDWDESVVACLSGHEEHHASQEAAACQDCDIGPAAYPDQPTRWQDECEAYNAQLDCLAEIDDQLGTPGWSEAWMDAVNAIRGMREGGLSDCPSDWL